MKYLFIGEIEEVIIDNYSKTQKGLDFRKAAIKLQAMNKIHEGTPDIPDFLSWDITNLDQLKELVSKISVPMDLALSLHPDDIPQVLINLEFYNPDTFRALPYISFLYVLSGTVTFYTENETYHLEKGSILILSPELPHRLFCTSEDIVINIISEPDLFNQHFRRLLNKNELLSSFFNQSLYQSKKGFLSFILYPDNEVLSTIKHLFAEFVSDEPFSTEMFLNYLQILYSHILRNCDMSPNNTNLKSHSHVTMLPSILLHIQNEYKTITLSRLSDYFNYSPAYLSRLIKKETGKNFIEIIEEIKINAAKEFLRYTQHSISDIAFQVGYNSSNHFTHSFKKSTGMTPSSYRKNHKKKDYPLM